jgi:hypothetical protein
MPMLRLRLGARLRIPKRLQIRLKLLLIRLQLVLVIRNRLLILAQLIPRGLNIRIIVDRILDRLPIRVQRRPPIVQIVLKLRPRPRKIIHQRLPIRGQLRAVRRLRIRIAPIRPKLLQIILHRRKIIREHIVERAAIRLQRRPQSVQIILQRLLQIRHVNRLDGIANRLLVRPKHRRECMAIIRQLLLVILDRLQVRLNRRILRCGPQSMIPVSMAKHSAKPPLAKTAMQQSPRFQGINHEFISIAHIILAKHLPAVRILLYDI